MTVRSLLKAAACPAALALALSAALSGPSAAQDGPRADVPPPLPLAPLPPPDSDAWVRLPAEDLMVIDTSKGRVVVELRPEFTPEHVTQVKSLVRMGFYDGLQFFRVIPGFMDQTGDAANTGSGDSPLPALTGAFSFRRGPESNYVPAGKTPGGQDFGFIGPMATYSQPDMLALMTVDGKVNAWGAFCAGVAGMARTQDPNSASSQFFLMRAYAEFLDQQYTPWGRVVVGQDVANAITAGEPPTNPDTMTRVRIASDLPEGERPVLYRLDPASDAFKAEVSAAMAQKGAAFTPCDVPVVVRAG